jgi:hypothetical protein
MSGHIVPCSSQTRLLAVYSEPFTNSHIPLPHYCVLGCGGPHGFCCSFCLDTGHWFAVPTGAVIIWKAVSTRSDLSAPFSNMLHSHYVTTNMYQLTVKCDGGHMFSVIKPNRTNDIFPGICLCRYHCTSTYPLRAFDLLTLAPSVTCYRFCKP